MNTIQGGASTQAVAQMFQQSGVQGAPQGPPPGPPPAGPPPEQLNAITNSEGQSLLDIKDQMDTAIAAALEGNTEDTDVRAIVDAAINAVLEENGFDPAAVKSAMEESMGTYGPPKGGPPPPPPTEVSEDTEFSIEDLMTSVLGSEEGEVDLASNFVESFLMSLRPGSHMDVSA